MQFHLVYVTLPSKISANQVAIS